MSSINTNVSAMTALQSLNMTNKRLESTQSAISTGYRINSAKDNAAYWSIATTMRSDNKAMSTVQDALGLGSAKLDVASVAMNSAKEVVDEIKVKLVAAREPGVDRTKVQSEIGQLQEQLTSISEASNFSGTNWLSVDSSSTGYSATQQIVSSFIRAGDGSVSVGTMDIQLSTIALFDASAVADANGILEGGTAAQGTSAAFAYTQGTFADADTIQIGVTVDGGAQALSFAVADAANFDLDALATGINSVMTGATASADSGALVLTSATTGTSSSVEMTSFATTQADATTAATIGFTTIASVSGAATGGGIQDIDISSASNAEIDAWISIVDGMAENMTSSAADLGAATKRVSMQNDFISNLMDAIERGVGQLVDADMTEESTKLQALQVQQQLGVQALSIANGQSQNILSLFR
ncbi:MAG: flagellin C [Hyphomicrobiales bacterium]|nr:flagellin C [Hyphomicrobiales bacterium]